MDLFEIVFDGGSKGNPGRGYGSYVISSNGTPLIEQQLTFDHLGDQITNNQAEYMTLIHALERLALDRAGQLGTTSVTVFGDSQLVLYQVAGRWKVKNDGLRPLQQRAKRLIESFGAHQLTWHARSNSVRILGH